VKVTIFDTTNLPPQIQTKNKTSFIKNTIDLPSSILRKRGILIHQNVA
jgi:hypothetical protein